MSNSYFWAVNYMTAYPRQDGYTDVVFQVGWVCSGTNGQFSAASYGAVDVTYIPGSPYIPYSDLTLPIVNQWVADALGPEGIAIAQAEVDASIASQENPATTNPALPW